MALVLANQGSTVVDMYSVQTRRKKGIKHFVPLPKREKSRWGPIPKRKRWGQPDEQKTLSEDMKHLAEVAGTMGEKESQVYFLKMKLAENARKLYNPVAALKDNPNELSPSPPPQYDSQGKRLNTKEYRYRTKLETMRNDLLTQILKLEPTFKIPPHWRKPIYRKRLELPAAKHPEVNFFGLIVGPRGMNQKRMSKETGCNIFVRGRGSFSPGTPGRTPQEDDNDPMYVAISGPSQAQVDKAYKMCKDLIDQSTSGDAAKNKQLAELRTVLGWGGNAAKRCRICGGVGHPIWKCPDRPGANWDPAQVQCALCGEVTHITSDCKLFDKSSPVVLQKKAMTLDEEYTKFLDDLAGDGSMNVRVAGAITGTQATTAEVLKSKAHSRVEKSRVYRGGRQQNGRGRGNFSNGNFRGGGTGLTTSGRGMAGYPTNQMQQMFPITPFHSMPAQVFQQPYFGMSMMSPPASDPYNPKVMHMPAPVGYGHHSGPFIPSQLPPFAPTTQPQTGYQL